MTPEELNAKLLNSFESLSRKIDNLQETIKKNTETQAISNNSLKDLKTSIDDSNKIFNQVSESIKELYAKVQQFEMFAKLAKQLGPMLGGLGGFGAGPPPKK